MLGLIPVGTRVLLGLDFTCCGQWAIRSIVTNARYQQIFGWEARNNFAPIFGDHKLFFDARSRPAIACWPERLERENHPLFDHLRMVERDQAAKDWLLPDRESYAVAILQSKCCFLVWKSELLCFRPELDDIGRRHTRFDCVDGDIENIATILVCIHHCLRCATYRECSIVTCSIPVVAMQDIEIGWIAWT